MSSDHDENSDRLPVASFYKLILKPRLDLQKLEIPREFMRNHGNELSSVIYLTVQPKKVWKIELVREDGRAILRKGWPEFVKFYSLDHGHFLMFHYRGKSQFEVIICDTSASEITYPFDPLSYEETPSKKKRKPNHHLMTQPTSSKKGKKMQIDEMVKDDKLIVAEIIGMSDLTPNETRRIRAYAYECKHRSFVKKMQASFVDNGSYMGVPKKFVNEFLPMELPFDYTFHLQTDEDGTKWPVKIIGDKSRVRLKSGWKTFASENRLKVGDVCIFELINEQMFKVHILRVAAKFREKS